MNNNNSFLNDSNFTYYTPLFYIDKEFPDYYLYCDNFYSKSFIEYSVEDIYNSQDDIKDLFS